MRELINSFKETKCDLVFSEIYKTLEKDIKSKVRFYKTKGFDEHSILAGCDDALIESIEKWQEDKAGFKTFFKRVIDSRVIDSRRKELRNEEREVYENPSTIDEEYCQSIFESGLDLNDFPDVESEVLKEYDNIDYRRLVVEILKKVDEPLRQQLLVIADGRSANYAARQFGMHHQTLNRKITKLARMYSGRYEEIRKYT